MELLPEEEWIMSEKSNLRNNDSLPKINIDCRLIICILFALISLVVSTFLIMHNGINGVDAYYYWVNSAYSARGYNLEWVKESGFVIDSIGKMQGIGVLPYGRVLSNFLLPGFLSYNAAYIYNWILILFITVLLFINIFRWVKEKSLFNNIFECATAALSMIMIPWLWPGYLRAGNIGGIIALMAILSAFYISRNENVAALLIAFALIKPQIGGIFLIAVFLKKNYRLVVKILSVIAISEVIHFIYIGIMNKIRGIYWPVSLNSIISIFEGYAGKNAEAERGDTWYLYYGIFNMLKEIGVPVFIVLLLSMIAGVAFLIIILKLIKKNSDLYNDYVIIFAIASLSSLFWFYKSECDNIVIILCNIIVLLYLKESDKKILSIVAASIFLAGMNWLVGRYILRFGINVVSYYQGILIDQILQIILFTMMIILVIKKTDLEKIEN